MLLRLNTNISTILILIILQVVWYYSTRKYDKIFCKTLKLQDAKYIIEVFI